LTAGSLTDYYFPRALIPGLVENEEAVLSAAITTIELDALCTSNVLKAGESSGDHQVSDSTSASRDGSGAGQSSTSAWTVRQTSLLISSLILTQNKVEAQFLGLHGSDPCERESVFLSPIAIFGPEGTDAIFRHALKRKLQSVRSEEQGPSSGPQPRSQSPLRSRLAQPLGQLARVGQASYGPPKGASSSDRRRGFEYLEAPGPAKSANSLTKIASVAPIATQQHVQAVQSFLYLLQPTFLFMDERPTDRVFLPSDASEIQAMLPVLRAVQNEALAAHFRVIFSGRLSQGIAATRKRLEAIIRLNSRVTPPTDRFYEADGIGQSYVNFLLANGEGARIATLLNKVLATKSHASPFSESGGQSVGPSILTSLAMAVGLLPHVPDRSVVAEDERTSYTIKLNAAIALCRILAALPSTYPAEKKISTVFAGLDLATAQRIPHFTERGVLEVSAARLWAGLVPFLAARVVALLKQGLRNARLSDPKEYLHGVMPVFRQVQRAMPEYRIELVPAQDSGEAASIEGSALNVAGGLPFAPPSADGNPISEQLSQELVLFRVPDLLQIFDSTKQQLELSLNYLLELQAGFRHGVLEASVRSSSGRQDEIYSRHALREVGLGLEVRRRALAGLVPAALEYTQEVSRLTHSTQSQAQLLCLYEGFLREALHREMGRRVMILLDSVKLARRQKLLIAFRKNQIIREAVSATRKRYEPYLANIDKVRKNGDLADPSGVGMPSNSAGPDILGFYQENIETLQRQREEITLRLLATRHFDNFRAALLRDKSRKTSQVVGRSLVACVRNIWDVMSGLADVDASLGRKLAGEQALINETASRLVEMRAEVETYNSGPNKSRLAAASAKARKLTEGPSESQDALDSEAAAQGTGAVGTVANRSSSSTTGLSSASGAYASLARKILPSLKQKSISESRKACTDAENKLILLRRKIAEKEALEREKESYTAALEQGRKQMALRQRELRREIAKEKKTQAQASARLGDLQASVKSTQAAARTVQMNAMALEEEMREAEREKLQNEIDVAAMETRSWEDKIADLRDRYPEILGGS